MLLARLNRVLRRIAIGCAIGLVSLLSPISGFAQPAPSDQPARGDGLHVGWETHPQLEWRGLRLEFRGQLQAVNTDSDGAIRNVDSETFDVARRRFTIDGTIGKRLRFQAEAEVDRDDPGRDLYLDYRAARAAQFRGGTFKLPFGLEENISHARLEFINRSLMSRRLAPGRDTGAMLYGRAGRIAYETGVFVHDGENAQPGRAVRLFGGPTAAGRITVEPFRGAKTSAADLEIGAAMTYSRLPEGYPAVRGRTLLGVSFFDADFWVSGARRRTGVELRWRPGPFAFMAEAITLTDERRGQSLERTDLPPVDTRGWYVSGSWVVAGAERASRVDEPRTPLFGGGWGALQLAVRREELTFGRLDAAGAPLVIHRAIAIPGARETATTGAVTWYATRWTRLQLNLVREQLRGALPQPAPPSRVWSRLISLQVVI